MVLSLGGGGDGSVGRFRASGFRDLGSSGDGFVGRSRVWRGLRFWALGVLQVLFWRSQ